MDKRIVSIIKRFVNKWSGIADVDDLYQEAIVVVLQMMPKYDEKRGDLASFIRLCLTSHFSTMGHHAKKRNETFLHVEVDQPENSMDELFDRLWVEQMLKKLSESARKVFICLAGLDDDFEEWKEKNRSRGKKSQTSLVAKYLGRDIQLDLCEIKLKVQEW